MNSPRYGPAGLLVTSGRHRVMLDGGPGAEPRGRLDAWLVTDERCELIREIRARSRALGIEPAVASHALPGIRIEPRPVTHTSHPTVGYLIALDRTNVVWAPEFLEFPSWARGARLMFAEAAGYDRPIHFAHAAGGHASLLAVANDARRSRVGTLVFSHIGRPTLRALDRGERPPFGMVGEEGDTFLFDRSAKPAVLIHRHPRHA
jgi:hypothetical protein